MALGGNTGHPHQPIPHHLCLFSCTSLHGTWTSPLLFLSHFSTMYLFTVMALGGTVSIFHPPRAKRCLMGLWYFSNSKIILIHTKNWIHTVLNNPATSNNYHVSLRMYIYTQIAKDRQRQDWMFEWEPLLNIVLKHQHSCPMLCCKT